MDQPIGIVTHYYGGIGVATVKLSDDLKAGDKIRFIGRETNFEEEAISLEMDHEEAEQAKAGQEIGIKVREKVREGDKVFKIL